MSGVMNKTARQFNLKTMAKGGRRVVVRLAPGFNVVEDEHWKAFVDGKANASGKADPYVTGLKDKGHIDYGTKMDDLELERDPDTKSKSKAEPVKGSEDKK